MTELKETLRNLITEIFDEDKAEKAKADKASSKMYEYSSEHESPQPTSRGPYMVIYVKPCSAPFRITVDGLMGKHKALVQSNIILCIEQSPEAIERLKNDSKRIEIVKTGLDIPPSRKKMMELKAAYGLTDKELEAHSKKVTKQMQKKQEDEDEAWEQESEKKGKKSSKRSKKGKKKK